MIDPKKRFDKTADDYERYRPSYPAALIDWIAAKAKLARGARVVDVGCGTGIAARLFAARGYEVTGVDPSEEMLEKARPGDFVRGEAEATGLPSARYDLAISAQAFHWFDVPRTMKELGRILKPGAPAAAFWNLRAKTPLMDGYQALLDSIGEYRNVPKAHDALARIDASPLAANLESSEFESSQRLDRYSLRGRARSSSYVAHGVADLAAFERKLDALFDAHAKDGHVDFKYRTVVRLWTVKPPTP